MIEIKIYSDNDIKKDGSLKKKNNSQIMQEEEFKQYVKDNNLSLSKGYIDLVGFISNGLKFRCYYKNIVVGVTNIINSIKGV